jgi:cytochrome c peroxidase
MNCMRRRTLNFTPVSLFGTIALLGTVSLVALAQDPGGVTLETFNNSVGMHSTFSTLGPIPVVSQTNPFFLPTVVNGQTNGKTCEHCHFASDSWGLLVDHANQLFNDSQGLHPLFTPDAADNPAIASDPANVATLAQRQQVYSLMLKHGLALVRINAPTNAEFTVIGVDDASIPDLATHRVTIPISGDSGAPTVQAGDPTTYFNYTMNFNQAAFGVPNKPQFWFHRRPIPTTNEQFLSEVSWDGRSSTALPLTAADIRAGIKKVAHDTIIARQNGASLDPATQDSLAEQMTDFMLSTTTAQIFDTDSNGFGAGSLMDQGALNGPVNLAMQPFSIGINDPFSGSFTSASMTLYNSDWVNQEAGPRSAARAKILRGQQIFNTRKLLITGVNGLNDGPGKQTVLGTCTTCHNTPNVGDHSSRFDVALGVASITINADGTKVAPAGLNQDAISDLPVFTLRNNATGEITHVTDLGLASVTGKWDDIGKFKVALPRTLEARSPYFHNGGPTSLEELVSFYNHRFKIHLSEADQSDLIAFLKAL